jgi:hypothetical protein
VKKIYSSPIVEIEYFKVLSDIYTNEEDDFLSDMIYYTKGSTIDISSEEEY